MPQTLYTDDIWAEMRRRRITATDVARVLGVAHTTVSRAINGDIRTPNPRLLYYIAALLGVSVEQLCPGRRSPSSPTQTTKRPASQSISDTSESRTRKSEKEAA